MTGKRNVPFAGITCRFYIQDFAACRRVGQASHNARLARFQFGFAEVLRRAEHFRHDLWRDRGVFSFSARDLRCNTTANRGDLALELADTSFMRVIVDDVPERFLLPLALLGFKPVLFQLPPNQISLRDLKFLALGVTGQ